MNQIPGSKTTRGKTPSSVVSIPTTESAQNSERNQPAGRSPRNKIIPIRSGAGNTPLRDGKHERFAQNLASGQSAAEAYRACGYRGKGASQSASRLLRRAEVAARVEELKTDVSRAVVARIAVTEAWVRNELVGIALRSRESGETGEAIRALSLLGKSLGMFVTGKKELQNNAQMQNLADRLVNARLRARAFEAQRKAAAAKSDAVPLP